MRPEDLANNNGSGTVIDMSSRLPLVPDQGSPQPTGRRSALLRHGATALLVGILVAGPSGCGEEHVSRADVIDALTKNGIERSLAECVMESMPQSDLDDLAAADSELSPEAADRVAQVAADCATTQVEKTTTTAKTTTTKAGK